MLNKIFSCRRDSTSISLFFSDVWIPSLRSDEYISCEWFRSFSTSLVYDLLISPFFKLTISKSCSDLSSFFNLYSFDTILGISLFADLFIWFKTKSFDLLLPSSKFFLLPAVVVHDETKIINTDKINVKLTFI